MLLTLWPLAHIQGRPSGAVGTVKMRPTTTPFSSTSQSSWLSPIGARLGISGGIGAARPSSPTAPGCTGGTATVPPTDIPSGLVPRDAGMEDARACCLDQVLIFGPTDVAQSLVRTQRNGKL